MSANPEKRLALLRRGPVVIVAQAPPTLAIIKKIGEPISKHDEQPVKGDL